MYVIQHSFICRPSDSPVPEDAGIEPRTVATLAWTARRSNHLARSYPLDEHYFYAGWWIRIDPDPIRIQHFSKLRIQGFYDQKLKKFKAGKIGYFDKKNCN
jgi:hypothetical protein